MQTEKVGHNEAHLFQFCVPKKCFYWEAPNVPKKIGDGQIIVAPSKKNQKQKM
jgi:hypothetical protein